MNRSTPFHRRICRAAIACAGSPGRPGQRTSVTAGCPRSASTSAAAFAACRASRRSRVPSPRCASQASIGPGTAPPRVRASRSRSASAGSRGADVAEHHVAVPGQRLGVAGHHQVGAQRQRALAERGGGGVVHGQQRTGGVRGAGGRGDVARRPGRGWTGSPAAPAPRRRARRPATPPPSAPRGRHPERGELGVRERPGQVVAVRRQHQRAVARRPARTPPGSRPCRRRTARTRRRRARRSPPPAPARSGCRPGRRSPAGSARRAARGGTSRTAPGRGAAARRSRPRPWPAVHAARAVTSDHVTSAPARGARLISSLPISATDSPSWQTRRTASAIGSSTPCRSPSAQIDEHDFTPSATWPWLASSACGQRLAAAQPLAEGAVARQRRRAGGHQVAQPGQPGEGHRVGAQRDARAGPSRPARG